MRIRIGLTFMIFILGLLMGCDGETVNGNQVTQEDETSQTEEVLGNRKEETAVPYKRQIYTKTGSDFSWEWSAKNLPEEIIDQYENYVNSVPGGFVIQETPSEYFICVSFGRKESVTKGFKINSLAMHDIDSDRSFLRIHAIPVSDEDVMDKDVQGEVTIRALISVAKKDLPGGIGINEMILSVEEEK
ncbi:hypothetical protein [Paenibacillus gallinarum]|uniref:Lipoprotein n=1 Tax=Paenibacillus gallinarum TaxID=2762232 RepID=A0ABR8ST87_9BACL|nr:hypothetical protein [Paenibacillus gallinarum]MBD7966706.1 hypothetical protein [Paenibacillus gallinarum]